MNMLLFKRNVSFSFLCNLISFIVSLMGTFLLPKYMSPENYGGWQLYLFYYTYTGFFHFGWLDGMYLRYGGMEYKKLRTSVYGPEFCCLIIFEVIVALAVFVYSHFYIVNIDLQFILYVVAITGILTVLRSFFSFVLQMTNRIEEYAKITVLERILFLGSIIVFVAIHAVTYKQLAIFDVFVKIFSLLYAIYYCKDLLGVCKISKNILQEIKINIKVGVNLMFANIASMLILGIMRFSVSQEWDLSTFGKLSLTIAISSFLMVFINSVSVVLFPALRTVERKTQTIIYCNIRKLLMPILLFMLISYYPLRMILLQWLPGYGDSFMYMAILFPICVYQCNMSLLVNTYLKCLRQERLMFNINLVAVLMSIVFSGIFAYLLHNLNLVIFSMVFVCAFRSILSEYYLTNILKLNINNDIISEVVLVLTFMVISWNFNQWYGGMLYLVAFCIYFFFNREQCKNAYVWFLKHKQ